MHRSTFLPLQHTATLIFSVDWGLELTLITLLHTHAAFAKFSAPTTNITQAIYLPNRGLNCAAQSRSIICSSLRATNRRLEKLARPLFSKLKPR